MATLDLQCSAVHVAAHARRPGSQPRLHTRRRTDHPRRTGRTHRRAAVLMLSGTVMRTPSANSIRIVPSRFVGNDLDLAVGVGVSVMAAKSGADIAATARGPPPAIDQAQAQSVSEDYVDHASPWLQRLFGHHCAELGAVGTAPIRHNPYALACQASHGCHCGGLIPVADHAQGSHADCKPPGLSPDGYGLLTRAAILWPMMLRIPSPHFSTHVSPRRYPEVPNIPSYRDRAASGG